MFTLKEAFLWSTAVFIPSSALCFGVPVFSDHFIPKTLSRHCQSFWMLNLTYLRPGTNPKHTKNRGTPSILLRDIMLMFWLLLNLKQFSSQNLQGSVEASLCKGSHHPLPTPKPLLLLLPIPSHQAFSLGPSQARLYPVQVLFIPSGTLMT